MSQKELLYLEDIYNHEMNIINNLCYYSSIISDTKESRFIDEQIKSHNSIIKDLEDLLEENR